MEYFLKKWKKKLFVLLHFYINPCHSLFFGLDHLRSNMGIICCARSFAALGSFANQRTDPYEKGNQLILILAFQELVFPRNEKCLSRLRILTYLITLK